MWSQDLKFRPNAKDLGFSLSTAQSSADVYSIDLDPNSGLIGEADDSEPKFGPLDQQRDRGP